MTDLQQPIVYLIPLPIAENALHTLSAEIPTITAHVTHYFVENTRTCRRFLKAMHPQLAIDTLQFSEIDKHTGADIPLFKQWLQNGYTIGIMSEAGCPGIADPGAELIAIAHTYQAKVIPLTGPSSILLALMASGLNGQTFAFNGYLPIKDPQRSKRLKELELRSQKEQQTQIWIETPYRNNLLVNDLLKHCNPNTQLCIAQNLTATNAFLKTDTCKNWLKATPMLEKAPAVFLLLAH